MKSGIINVYKEAGFTSFDVVAKLRGILKTKKIGHTGTLDPDATGVLPVCIGKATKVCDLLTDKDKVYEAVLLLGTKTDTLDISGEVLQKSPVMVDEMQVREVIKEFVGEQKQIPPMYSALKINGQKLCDLARKGIEVERQARDINVFSIDILEMKLPRIRMQIHCSKGTYIRSLCDDIGETLGCGGCMESLIRTRVAGFSIEDAHSLDEIQEMMQQERVAEWMITVDQVFEQYPAIYTLKESQKKVVNGAKLVRDDIGDLSELLSENDVLKSDEKVSELQEEQLYRIYTWDNQFVGIYLWKEGQFILQKMFLE